MKSRILASREEASISCCVNSAPGLRVGIELDLVSFSEPLKFHSESDTRTVLPKPSDCDSPGYPTYEQRLRPTKPRISHTKHVTEGNIPASIRPVLRRDVVQTMKWKGVWMRTR
jgi:hypothetical protein